MTNASSNVRKPDLVRKRQKQIVDSAVPLFAAKGYNQTTIGEIARDCGMSKGNIYNYIKTKEDIILLIQDHIIENYKSKLSEIDNRTYANYTEALSACIRAYIESIDEVQDAIIFNSSIVSRVYNKHRHYLLDTAVKVNDDFEAMLMKGINSGEFFIENPKLLAHHIVYLASAWARSRWYLRKFCTLEEFTKQLINVFTGAVKQTSLPVNNEETIVTKDK